MKKFLPYLTVIVVCTLAIGWYIRSQSAESINQREGDFAVKGPVTKIILDDTRQQHVVLENKNGQWIVNGKFVAREELIAQLLDAVQHVTSLAPVPRAAHDHVIREMMATNVKVQVFTGKNEPEKVYYVGGPTVDNRQTYMLLETDGQMASRPQMTYVPGYNGYLTPRFNPDEENWRSRIVFNEQANDLDTLTVEYPGEEQHSFTIVRVTDDSFAVHPVDEKYRISQPYEQKYVRQYLGFYRSIYLEAFDNQNPVKDSVMHTTPYCRFRVVKKDGTEKSVLLFYMPLNRRSKAQIDRAGNDLDHDIDHFYAAVNQSDFALVQYYVFGKLLRQYRDFFFKPTG